VDTDIKCDKCGTSFLRSKFLPYVTSCPTCRKGTLVATGEKKTCDTCSKKFAPSKFNPYLSTCPECRAAERKAAAKKAKPEKTEKAITAKVAEQIDS
jgi:Zn finger protein HypA/HybF involved in hydrogenase expression